MPSPQPRPALDDVIHADPARMGGVPVFRGTRVPVKALFDYLQAGRSVHQFLSDFEGVTEQAVQVVLAAARDKEMRPGL